MSIKKGITVLLLICSFSVVAQVKLSKKEKRAQKKSEKFEAIKTSFEKAAFTFEVKSISSRGSHVSITSNATGRGIVELYGDKANVHLASIRNGNTDTIYLESEMEVLNYMVSYLDSGKKVVDKNGRKRCFS